MLLNFSNLRLAPVDVELDKDDSLELQDREAELAGPMTGHLRLHRTNLGIYATAPSRCPYTSNVHAA